MSHCGAHTTRLARQTGIAGIWVWCCIAQVVAQTRPIQLEPSSASPSAAQDVDAQNGDSIASLLQQIAQGEQKLAGDTERTPEVKEQLAKSYAALRIDLESAQKVRQRRLEYADAITAAPAMLEVAKARQAELEKKQPVATKVDIQALSFEELDQERMGLEAELATATAERTALSDSTTQREKRRKELPQLISDAKAKLGQLDSQAPLNSATNNSEAPLLQEASTWIKDTSRLLVSEQQQAYESEQRLYEAEALLLPLKLEIAQSTEKRLQERLRLVNEQLEQLRANRIQGIYREAQKLTAEASTDVRPVGEQLLLRIKAWLDLSTRQAKLQEELEESQGILTRWSERRNQMVARVEPKAGPEGVSKVISGFNSWVGLMLRKQRGELPDPQQLQAKIRGYQNQMQVAESLLFDIEDAVHEINLQRDRLADRLDRLEGENVVEDSSGKQLLDFAASASHAMRLDVNAYQDDLYALADIRENTIRLTSDYREFIDKHVLWIRSAEPLTLADVGPGVEAGRWLVDGENWRAASMALGSDVRRVPAWYVLFLLLAILLIANQSRLRGVLSQLSAKAEKNSCTVYRLTARSLVITTLLTAPLPLILCFFQWRFAIASDSAEITNMGIGFQAALASALWLTAAVFTPLELSRQLCRPAGLGIKHFGWDQKIALRLRANLRWLIYSCIPLTLLMGMFLNHSIERWESSLGRVAFILLMPVLSIFFAFVLAPRSGIVSGFLEHHRGGWVDRLSWLWYPAHLVYPLALAAVSYVGYHYTAQRIATHMVATLWLVVLLSVAYHMLMRWLVINRRRLMLSQARQRLEEAARREPQQGETVIVSEEPRINLVAINEQTKRLVTSLTVALGLLLLFFIWSDVLPAVSMLDGIHLWPLHGNVTEETFTITLANVLLLVPLSVLFIILGRNVPGLLEIAFLQHLPLTSAARYAITTLSRYAIVALGIVVVSSIMRLQWSSIQWLVAALGVGLGFGLQEIFANFVSGIILLFEQPIRVGDIISIDGTTGSVSRIRMRATTIVNWDRQELIVPNKDLITGKLLNWTLTDSTNRILVNVGVAYGSDTQRACELIMQICKAHDNVLHDPSPSVTFEGFGDNSLNLVLRAFLDSLEHRLVTIHELHQQIYQAFNTAQIEIAFPQRDLHIRTLPEKWNRWLDQHAEEQGAGNGVIE